MSITIGASIISQHLAVGTTTATLLPDIFCEHENYLFENIYGSVANPQLISYTFHPLRGKRRSKILHNITRGGGNTPKDYIGLQGGGSS